MSHFSFSKFGENLPVTGVVAASQVAVGFGAGLLFAEKLGRSTRERIAITLICAGVATILPTVLSAVNRVANRPTSARRMRRRLDSIRGDSGISEETF